MTRIPLHQSLLRTAVCAVLLLGSFSIATSTFSQDAAPTEEATSVAPKKNGTTLLDRFNHGGWVMYPITLCSVALIWLTVDLWMRTSGKRIAPPRQVHQVQNFFRGGDYVGAYQYCKNNSSPFCDVTRVALSFVGEGEDAVEAALFAEMNKANSVIQTRINYLSVLGVCTPMIGLTGTVTGMMGAFDTLGMTGVSDTAQLSSKISEVLIATASGLFIAVPAFMVFYFLRNRLQGSMHVLQEAVGALFRKMPYSHLKDAHVGEEEFYAAVPNWVTGVPPVAATVRA